MSKLNSVLLLILIASAAGLVTSQHRARNLFAELEREHQATQQIQGEWDLLQLELSTQAKLSHIEDVALTRLRMSAPKAHQVRMLQGQGEAR